MEEGTQFGELAWHIVTGTADGLCVLDEELRVVLWNAAMAEATGIRAGQAVGQPILALFPDLPRSRAWREMERGLAGQRVKVIPWLYEVGLTGKKGYARLEVIRLKGEPGRLLVTFRDITGQAESRRLEAANVLLDVILRSAPVAIVAMDRRQVVTFWNPGAERIFGWTAEEAVGHPLPFLGEEFDNEHRMLCQSAARSGTPVEAEVVRRRKDGSTVEVGLSLQAVRGAEGELRGYTAIYQDISGRKQAERELRNSESRLERAQEIARMGTYEAAFPGWPPADDGISYWSPGVYEILGLDPRMTVASPRVLLEMTHPEDRARLLELTRQAREPGSKKVGLEHRVVLAGGEVRVVRHHAEVTKASDGTVHVTGAMQDITEYRRLEEQLLQSQKLEGIGQLAGGIAHDFNNLLTVINGYADLLARDEELAQGARDAAAAILSAGRRAAELTQQLLAFSRRQILQPKAVNLNAALMDLRRMLDRLLGAHISVVEKLEPALGLVFADEGQLQQVMLNLIVNARDAMPEGGRLTLETSNETISEKDRAAHPDAAAGAHVCLAVSDTGAGMDARTKERIFEPFFTTKEMGRGTGLGLATVYGIVKQSHGFIQVDSELGRGTTIRVYLPVMSGQALEAQSGSAAERRLGEATGTILVVEDQEPVRLLAARVLREQGYKVLEASSGEEALQAAAAESGRIDLLFTDVVMPGMAVKTLTGEFQKARPEAKILYTSGYSENLILREGILKAGIELLPKPFSPRELLERVQRMLEAGRG
jgi:PAS domain S-box-containing protein